MKQIIGHVVVHETGTGIPNLVVTCYDCGQAVDVLRRKAPTAEVMKQLGRRMSSVLTDQNGTFVLSEADLEFVGNEPRPDLIAVVFAPEDIKDPDHPYPKPPEARVLYMSVVPRTDSGAQEAFHIRLSRAVVAHHQIDPTPNRASKTLHRDWDRHDAIRDQLALRSITEMLRKSAARAVAVKAVSNLHAVPLLMRNASNLVIGKAALSETVTSRVTDREGKEMTNAEHLQYSAMKAGLQNWKARGWAPTMRLELTDEEMKELEMEEESGSTTGNVIGKMLELTGGVDLVRKQPRTSPSPDELETRYLKGQG